MPFFVRACLCLLVSLAAPFGATADEWKAGLAKVVITPDEATWLSGYSSRTEPAEGKVHDLYAKAIAIEGPDRTRLVLITMDLGSISPRMTERVSKLVSRRFSLPRANLVLNCSHTHCAPEVAAERRVFHNLSDAEEAKLAAYIEQLIAKLADLVGAALDDLRPARLTVGKSSAAFAFNRRHPSGIDETGVTDRETPVLRVTDLDGNLRGILFGYACHNTTLAFQQYCGDYAGFAQQELESRHPDAIAMFVMGCGGDQNPQPRHGPLGLEHARSHGTELADAVEKALAGGGTELHGELRVAFEVVSLNLEPLPAVEQLRRDAETGSEHARRKAAYLLKIIDGGGQVPLTQPCPLHVAKIGDELLMIFISGETVVDYSLACKRKFAGPAVWVAGYCDDVFAYLPSRRVLLEGGYEGRNGIVHQLTATPFLPSVEDRVMHGIERLVARVNAAP